MPVGASVCGRTCVCMRGCVQVCVPSCVCTCRHADVYMCTHWCICVCAFMNVSICLYYACFYLSICWASVIAQAVKNLSAVQETWVRSLSREDPLEKEMTTHSSVLAWRIPWMEEPGGLPSMGSHRVGYDWSDLAAAAAAATRLKIRLTWGLSLLVQVSREGWKSPGECQVLGPALAICESWPRALSQRPSSESLIWFRTCTCSTDYAAPGNGCRSEHPLSIFLNYLNTF